MSDPSPPSSSRQRNFVAAFLASILGTGMSRVLGALRDFALANYMGAGLASDAFWTAFTVPSVFRRFVADEGLTGALIPALAQAEADGADPHRLANTVLTALLLANLVLCGVGVLGAEWIVALFAPTWPGNPEKAEAYVLAVELTRWMFPFIAMVSLVSFFEGVLNHRKHFFIPKLAPGLVSAGIVAVLVLGADRFENPARAAAVGVIVGGIAHVLVNVPMVWLRWGPFGLGTAFSDPRFRRVLVELGKVIAIGVFAQINIIVLRQIATAQEAGAVTWYQYAVRITDLAQGMVAVAIGSALLPDVSRSVVEEAWEQLQQDIVGAVRLAAFLIFPAGAILVSFSEPLVALMFRHGQYSWADIEWTAACLRLLLPFLVAMAGTQILKKVYFALEDRGTLLKVGALGVLLTGGLGLVLSRTMGVAGLALALSISTTLQLGLYVFVLHRRLGAHLGAHALVQPLARVALASVAPAVVLSLATPLGAWELGPFSWLNLGVGGGSLVAAGLAYAAAARALGIEELDRVLGRLLARFGRR